MHHQLLEGQANLPEILFERPQIVAKNLAALAPQVEEKEPVVVLPGPNEPLTFGKHIKPMFRKRDRQSMQFAFDLWSYDDVAKHAGAILERLRNGSMPCDGAWPQERVAVFARWIASGKPE